MPPPGRAFCGRRMRAEGERNLHPRHALGYRVCAPDARNHAAHLQKLAPSLPARRLSAQLVEILPALLLRFLVEPLEVPDRVLLDVLEVHGTPLADVEVEER